jgi:hypothetical protein
LNPILGLFIFGGILYLITQEEDSPDEEPPYEKGKELFESMKPFIDPKQILPLPQEEVTRLRRELRRAIKVRGIPPPKKQTKPEDPK